MRFMRWRESVVKHLKVHNEATTEELMTKVTNRNGKLMRSHGMPGSNVGAANCLASDKRFVKVRYIKVIGTTKAVWGLKHDIRGEKYE
jgi:hypothetical protein